MIDAELTPDEEALLTAEGWRPVEGSAGDWRDPYSRDAVPAWRALELVRRDVGGVLFAKVVCLACVKARREGRPWGCLIHVAEDVL